MRRTHRGSWSFVVLLKVVTEVFTTLTVLCRLQFAPINWYW